MTYVTIGNKQYGGIKSVSTGTTTDPFTGFTLKGGRIEDIEDAEITPEGDAVVNVYFDRVEYTLRFYLTRTNNNGRDYYGSGAIGDTYSGNWNTPLTSATEVNGSAPSTYVTNGNYRYYYYSITARYGENIASRWINQSNITSSTSFVSWLLMPTAKAYLGSGSGKDTVKGVIGIMDEQVLGDLSSKTGNYVTARYGGYHSWTYHIYFADANGNYPATESATIAVRSNGTNATSQHAPAYEGYDNVSSLTRKGSGYDMYFYYTPKKYTINFMDGQYVSGNNDQLQNKSGEQITHVDNVAYGTNISSYNTYKPETTPAGYIFEGWYADKGGNSEYTFDTLPIGGLTVYAKWRQVQYRVFLHTGLTEIDDTNLDWGSTSVSLSFRVDYNKRYLLRPASVTVISSWAGIPAAERHFPAAHC